jgi:hypothetical protein
LRRPGIILAATKGLTMKHAAAAVLLLTLCPLGGPALAGNDAASEAGAAPRQKYDSVEVIRSVKDVDRSRVINTTTVIPFVRVPIAEVPIVTRVQFIVHRYVVEEVPLTYTFRRKVYVKQCRHGSRSYYALSCGRRGRARD